MTALVSESMCNLKALIMMVGMWLSEFDHLREIYVHILYESDDVLLTLETRDALLVYDA